MIDVTEEFARIDFMLDSVKEKLNLLSNESQDDNLISLADQGFFLELLENVNIAKELLIVTKEQFERMEKGII